MNPSDVNDAARLVMVAERCGPEILDNADNFDEVLGAGRFANLNRDVLNLARRVVSGKNSCLGNEVEKQDGHG